MTEKNTTPRERPLLMSGPLVRATLRDVNPKTVTRRLVRPQPKIHPRWGSVLNDPHAPRVDGIEFAPGTPKFAIYSERHLAEYQDEIATRFSPHGVRGDRLWIRETCAPGFYATNEPPTDTAYRADYINARLDEIPDPVRWTPSIHMPRWASRITLEIVDVRVERLQDITEEDARAEGLCEKNNQHGRWYHHDPSAPVGQWSTSPITAFRNLWDSLTDESTSWAANPWIWRIEYRRIKP